MRGPDFGAWYGASLTAESLAAAGLPVEPFAEVTIGVIRTSARGKFHLLPDEHRGQCAQLTRAFGYGRRDLPVQEVPVLADRDGCGLCYWIHLDGALGALWRACELAVAAADWVDELDTVASGFGWLQVAQWEFHNPFGQAGMARLLEEVSADPSLAGYGSAVATVWAALRSRAGAALQRGRQAAGPPGLRVLAARARDLVSRYEPAMREARRLQSIARPLGHHRDPFDEALTAWLETVAPDGDVGAGRTVVHLTLRRIYTDAQIHHVAALPDPAVTSPAGHATVAAWARAEFEELCRSAADGWCDLLEEALRGDAASTDRQLLLVVPWPVITDADAEIAYLTQYAVVGEAVGQPSDGVGLSDRVPQAAVLVVPETVVDHAICHRSPYVSAVAGPTLQAGETATLEQIRALLRITAIYLEADADDDPAATAAQVTSWRAEFRPWQPIELHDLPAGRDAHLRWPTRFLWVPTGGRADTKALRNLTKVYPYFLGPVGLHLAAGPTDGLTHAEITATISAVDPAAGTVSYLPQERPACPPVTVPLRRIIAIDAR